MDSGTNSRKSSVDGSDGETVFAPINPVALSVVNPVTLSVVHPDVVHPAETQGPEHLSSSISEANVAANDEDIENRRSQSLACPEPDAVSDLSDAALGKSWGAYAFDQLGTAAIYVGGAAVAAEVLQANVTDLVALAAGSAAIATVGQVAWDGVKSRAPGTPCVTYSRAINAAGQVLGDVLKAGVSALMAHAIIDAAVGVSVNVQNTAGVMAVVGGLVAPVKASVDIFSQYVSTHTMALPDMRRPLLEN